jgi:hypothetical protein
MYPVDNSGDRYNPYSRAYRDFDPGNLFKSLKLIVLILYSLIEILRMSPEQLEKLRRDLKEETLRQKAEYEAFTKYR